MALLIAHCTMLGCSTPYILILLVLVLAACPSQNAQAAYNTLVEWNSEMPGRELNLRFKSKHSPEQEEEQCKLLLEELYIKECSSPVAMALHC